MELSHEQLVVAWQQFAEAVQRAWEAIQQIIVDVVVTVVRVYHDLCRAHLMPRQYRETMMQRKLRALRVIRDRSGLITQT